MDRILNFIRGEIPGTVLWFDKIIVWFGWKYQQGQGKISRKLWRQECLNNHNHKMTGPRKLATSKETNGTEEYYLIKEKLPLLVKERL